MPFAIRLLAVVILTLPCPVHAQDSGGSENHLPSIAGSPPLSILQGDFLAFLPVASDADGDILTFWIANKPGWAYFDTSTGALYGLPSPEDVGLYSEIQIWVTDGEAWASLPAFDVDVVSADLPWVRLSWEPPTTNRDGSLLTNLVGYRIYVFSFGSVSFQSLEINNPHSTSYLLGNLWPDTFGFTITAINGAGMESDHSNSVIHVLQ